MLTELTLRHRRESVLSIEDEVLAARMEKALDQRKGEPYITRTKHGKLPAGTVCRVWRTPKSDIQVWVHGDNLPEGQVFCGRVSGEGQILGYVAAAWYFEGLETAESIKERYTAYYGTRHHRVGRVPRPF